MSRVLFAQWRRLVTRPLGAPMFVLAGCTAGLVVELGLGPILYAGIGAETPVEPVTEIRQEIDRGESDHPPEHPVDPQSLVASGPALGVPKEVLNLLDQRKRVLDQREEVLRIESHRLNELKHDLEELLDRYEASVKAFESKHKPGEMDRAKGDQFKRQPSALSAEEQESLDAVTRIYEAMPPEEAAARIEKMPSSMAVKVLRSVRGKTAGAILAQVRPDKAAKLTEKLFGPASKTLANR